MVAALAAAAFDALTYPGWARSSTKYNPPPSSEAASPPLPPLAPPPPPLPLLLLLLLLLLLCSPQPMVVSRKVRTNASPPTCRQPSRITSKYDWITGNSAVGSCGNEQDEDDEEEEEEEVAPSLSFSSW